MTSGEIINWMLQVFSAIFTSFGFGIIFRVRGINLIHTSIAGGMSWLIYLYTTRIGMGLGMSYFLATLTLSLYAEIVSIKRKTTVTAILVPALIPLAPGGAVYYTMYNILAQNYSVALEKGTSSFIMAGSMAVGVFTATTIIKIFTTKYS